MKFSTALLLSVLSATPFVSARPASFFRHSSIQQRSRRVTALEPAVESVGAAFFINNDPTENRVIVANITSDGTLFIHSAVSTNGRGAHGLGGDDPDGLFSQGAIKASQKGKLLATVNPGSNTISVFKINENNPTDIQLFGEPISSGGQFPISVAFNPNGDRLCALNGGEVAGVQCFSFQSTGPVSLSGTNRVLILNQTTPATGPGGAASSLIFNPDGTQLIASVKGTGADQGGFLAVWDVAADGSLSKDFKSVPPPKGSGMPFGMAFVSGKNALVAADPAVGFAIFDLAAGGGSAVAVEGQSAVCWIAFSEKTGTFFLSDVGTSIITEVAVDNNLQGSIVRQIPRTNGSSTIDEDIVNVNGNDILFVLAAAAGKVDTIRLDGKGKSQDLTALDVARPAAAAGIAFDGNNVQGMATFLTVSANAGSTEDTNDAGKD